MNIVSILYFTVDLMAADLTEYCLLFDRRPEAANEFYDGDQDNDKESDVEI